MNLQTLVQEIHTKKSFLCVGLDPDLNTIPQHLLDLEDPVFQFNKLIIDYTHDLCVAYKPNLAFYEKLGPSGIESLKKTIDYIPKQHFVIADAKRSDIFNSAKMYADTFYDYFGVDGVTISPFMGRDAVDPFVKKDKFAILLVATSNKNAFEIQNIVSNNGRPLYLEVVDKIKKWSSYKNIMFVIGANRLSEMAAVRNICPNHFFLVPGVGFQGGDLDEVCKFGFNSSCGLLINMSRSILYANSGHDFYNYSRQVCIEIQQQMNTILINKNFTV